MRSGALYDAADGRCLVAKVRRTETAGERMRGLLSGPPLGAGEGLLIEPCRMVHTLGMSYALDLAFIDARGQVRKLVRNLRPGRIAGSLFACATLELPAGALARAGLDAGIRVSWRPA